MFSHFRHGSVYDHSDYYHDYGLYYYFTPKFQLDGRTGWRFGDHAEQDFWAIGISTRF